MRFGKEGGRSATALAGAGLAVGGVGLVLAWRGELGVAVAAAAAAALLLAWLMSRNGARPSAQQPPVSEGIALVASSSVFPDPVILVDRRSLVVETNEPARALLPALKERQPLAFALRDPELLEAIPAVAASGEAIAVEIGGRMPTEPIYEVRLRRLPTSNAPGAGLPAVALFFRDLSAERRLETMRVDFIANVSHELRTPLASLSGFIDTLKGPARDDPRARERFLDIMQAQAGRMTRLIDDLLRLSRVELKEHLPPATPVDLAITVAHMVEVMTPLATERGVAIALDLPDTPLTVLADRDELLRLIENLIENAVKYGGSGGPVEVTAGRVAAPSGTGDRIELTVRDHGPGIAPEHLPRLTERFYRVDVAESRSQGGTGLGLAIVKHIVGRHRGRLFITSEPGRGATFRVQLPPAPEGVRPLS